MRDDYYCTLLAYCPAANVLAVGLENRAYIWSESRGVQNQALPDPEENECHITSLAFSSPGAARSILAIGRSDGRLNLWSVHEKQDRIKHILPRPVGCLAFKPVPTRRFSERINSVTFSEEILVGDERGDIYYYSLEWPKLAELTKPASLNLLAKISIHRQQVCGLVWSPDGQYFATGGNDNVCFLLSVQDILRGSLQDQPFRKPIKIPGMSPYAPDFIPNRDAHYTISPQYSPHSSESASNDSVASRAPVTSQNAVLTIGPDCARHCWQHSAAVKAIAFCPWQKGLIATGGGSNDRAIHFFHMKSGACLATIEVHAQVTSLIWSKTKREICATFGYSQPDHPFRIAVFSWPDCRQVVRIPWKDSMRALYAIPYPGGPNKERKDSNTKGKGRSKTRKRPKNTEGGTWWSRTKEEGCIVVASSDQSVKFHEVWSGHSTSMGARTGGLAWSSILESEEGGDIDFGGRDIIR